MRIDAPTGAEPQNALTPQQRMELGLCRFIFADHAADAADGLQRHPFAAVLEEIELADRVGLDAFGVGEHHSREFLDQAPVVVLGAAAARTRRIRLTTAATILSVADPVRVFQEFATLDGLSDGRAEIVVGRGSSIEPFALFGVNLRDYETIYEDKLELLLALRAGPRVHWSGRSRPPLASVDVFPRPIQRELPIWVGVGGSISSAARAGAFGLPMALGVIGGDYADFRGYADCYRAAAHAAGHPPHCLKISINAIGFVGDDRQSAMDVFFEPYRTIFGEIAKRAGWPPVTRASYERLASRTGALFVGGPQEVAEKIAYCDRVLGGVSRFNLQMSVGPLPYRHRMRAIELFGREVATRLAAMACSPGMGQAE